MPPRWIELRCWYHSILSEPYTLLQFWHCNSEVHVGGDPRSGIMHAVLLKRLQAYISLRVWVHLAKFQMVQAERNIDMWPRLMLEYYFGKTQSKKATENNKEKGKRLPGAICVKVFLLELLNSWNNTILPVSAYTEGLLHRRTHKRIRSVDRNGSLCCVPSFFKWFKNRIVWGEDGRGYREIPFSKSTVRVGAYWTAGFPMRIDSLASRNRVPGYPDTYNCTTMKAICIHLYEYAYSFVQMHLERSVRVQLYAHRYY